MDCMNAHGIIIMSSHFFDIEDAKVYGVDKAILLSNLRFWLTKNAANESSGHDGFYWTYNSSKAFERLFPYWSSNKIQKDLKALEKLGVIKSGNFNKSKYDRTKWYTIPLEFSFSQTDECNQPNEKHHSAKPLNEFSQKAQPIPDINTDIITDTKTLCASYDSLVENQFQILWQSYHNKKSKPDAVKAFKKFSRKYKADTLPQAVKSLISGIVGRLQANEIGISNILLASYLNKEKYNDECAVQPKKSDGSAASMKKMAESRALFNMDKNKK